MSERNDENGTAMLMSDPPTEVAFVAPDLIAAPVAGPCVPRSFPSAQAMETVDALEREMIQHPPVECPLVHRFTTGLYIREIFMPAGTLVTSKIHLTQHPYVVSKGRASVWIDGVGWKLIEAPYTGITQPGTRRVLYIHEDTVWTTFHPTTETDLEAIEAQIIHKHDEHLAGLMRPIQDALPAHLHELEGGSPCRG